MNVLYQDGDHRIVGDPADWRRGIQLERRDGDNWATVERVTNLSISIDYAAAGLPRLTFTTFQLSPPLPKDGPERQGTTRRATG